MTVLQAASGVKELDVVALVNVVLTGIALIIGAISGGIAAYAALRAGQAEKASRATSVDLGLVKIDVAKIEQNTNSMTAEIARLAKMEGERVGQLAGEAMARTLLEGQRQGRAQFKGAIQPPPSESSPLPVADDRVAVATEANTVATERIAAAAEKKSK